MNNNTSSILRRNLHSNLGARGRRSWSGFLSYYWTPIQANLRPPRRPYICVPLHSLTSPFSLFSRFVEPNPHVCCRNGLGAFYWGTVRCETHPGTLKWKSHEMTKAKTMHARRKLRNRCPCQNLLVSFGNACPAAVEFDSFDCSTNSGSPNTTTLHAVELQISQVLGKEKERNILGSSSRFKLHIVIFALENEIILGSSFNVLCYSKRY